MVALEQCQHFSCLSNVVAERCHTRRRMLQPHIVWLLCWISALLNLTQLVRSAEMFDFGECLMDLRLGELLRLKSSLSRLHPHSSREGDESVLLANTHSNAREVADSEYEASQNIAEDCRAPQKCHQQTPDGSQPLALALVDGGSVARGSHSPHKLPPATTYHHYHHTWHPAPEEKPSKLQTLFQISITALAFLSFGAYLLCLIVQAIKSKGTTYFHPVGTATTQTVNGNTVKRIKIYRRSRRQLYNNNENNYTEFMYATLPRPPYATRLATDWLYGPGTY